MKKKIIAITKRQIYLSKNGRIKDYLSKDWLDFSKKCNFELLPISNKTKIKLKEFKKKVNGVIFSGGGPITSALGKKKINKKIKKINFERDIIETKLFYMCKRNNIPLLGVCRGMQVINLLEIGKISKIKNHVSTFHNLHVKKKYKNIYNLPKRVNSYHDFGIKRNELGADLKEIGYIKNHIEFFKHKQKSIFGIMWHPERHCPEKKRNINFVKNIFKVSK